MESFSLPMLMFSLPLPPFTVAIVAPLKLLIPSGAMVNTKQANSKFLVTAFLFRIFAKLLRSLSLTRPIHMPSYAPLSLELIEC